ncbi:MAG: hypothetical protein ABIT37_24065 [Luteolibacter sp.]
MKLRTIAALMATCALAAGEKTPAKEKTPVEEKAAAPEKLPDVEAAIPDSVKALDEPAMMNFPSGIRMAVSTTSEKAQAHVNQGLNHLHGG